ncbi:MAG: aspartyl/asparaginyl beta-hydroxylase domain-containing protein [Geminicoccaceae bacterium]
MDIGVPLRDLGKVDVEPLNLRLAELDESAWTRNALRQELLAGGAHDATQSILFKYEWRPQPDKIAVNNFEDVIWLWCKHKGLDPTPFLPIERQDTDRRAVYTFPDYLTFKEVLDPLVAQVIGRLGKPGGIVTRLALVRLPAGGRIMPHVDGHETAPVAHRLHVSLTASPSVVYKIGGRKFTMAAGHAYDFNNCVQHSVRNTSRLPRINLFVDYYASPGPVIRNPLQELPPMYAPAAKRVA